MKDTDEIKIDRNGRNYLHNEVIANDYILSCQLVSNSKLLNMKDHNGWTPLHFAAQAYNYKIVALLIENKVTIDEIDNFGNTALFRAVFNCKNNSGDLIKLLLKAGANPNMENNSGISPYKLAQNIANYDIKKHFEKDS